MNTMINIENLRFVDGYFTDSSSWGDFVFENEGSFKVNDQSMTFKCDDIELDVNFTYEVEGSIRYESGDYWNPSSDEAVIGNVDVTITETYLDGEEVILDSTTIFKIEKLISIHLS